MALIPQLILIAITLFTFMPLNGQDLILTKKDRSKTIEPGSYLRLTAVNPDNGLYDRCSFLQVYGMLERVSSDSVYLMALSYKKEACTGKKRTNITSKTAPGKKELFPYVLAKSDIHWIERSQGPGGEDVRKAIMGLGGIAVVGGFVAGITASSIDGEEAENVQSTAGVVAAVGFAAAIASSIRRRYRMSNALKKKKSKPVWKIEGGEL